MDWISKLYNSLKIPLKIVLPAVWLFSGTLTLLSDEWLTKLNLLEWKNEYGSALGLAFLISSCLIIVYIGYFLIVKAFGLYIHLTRNRRTMKRLGNMSSSQFAIIIKLYKSYNYTGTLNISDPLVQSLLAGGYIYAGGSQLVTADLYQNAIYAKFVLQPFVCWALDYYKSNFERDIRKVEDKIAKEKDVTKREHLEDELSESREIYRMIYGG